MIDQLEPRLEHPLERLRERYDPSATAEQVIAAELLLAAGKGLRLKGNKGGPDYGLYLLRLRPGLSALAIFNERQHQLVTFLPPDEPLAYKPPPKPRGRRRMILTRRQIRARRQGQQGMPPR